MNKCFVKNYNIERMKPESGDKDLPVYEKCQAPARNALPKIIGTFLSVTPAYSNFIFSLIINFLFRNLLPVFVFDLFNFWLSIYI